VWQFTHIFKLERYSVMKNSKKGSNYLVERKEMELLIGNIG